MVLVDGSGISAKEEKKTANVREAEKNPSKEEGKTSKVKLNKKNKIPPRIIPRSHTAKNGISRPASFIYIVYL